MKMKNERENKKTKNKQKSVKKEWRKQLSICTYNKYIYIYTKSIDQAQCNKQEQGHKNIHKNNFNNMCSAQNSGFTISFYIKNEYKGNIRYAYIHTL